MMTRFIAAAFLLSCAVAARAAERIPVMDALHQGVIDLAIEGVQDGASLRVVAANNGNSALTVVVPAGKTKFEVQNFVVAMVIDKERIVQIASHKNATFTVPQEGTACLASGKVSWTNRGNTARYEEALFGACPHKSAKPRNLKNH